MAALLREYARTATLPKRTLAQYEELANDVVRAYTGDAASLDGIVAYFRLQRQMRWDRPPLDEQVARFRRGVRERLGRESDAGGDDALSLVDAQTLIARAEGFASWDELRRMGE
jgi:hypothetical protein